MIINLESTAAKELVKVIFANDGSSWCIRKLTITLCSERLKTTIRNNIFAVCCLFDHGKEPLFWLWRREFTQHRSSYNSLALLLCALRAKSSVEQACFHWDRAVATSVHAHAPISDLLLVLSQQKGPLQSFGLDLSLYCVCPPLLSTCLGSFGLVVVELQAFDRHSFWPGNSSSVGQTDPPPLVVARSYCLSPLPCS